MKPTTLSENDRLVKAQGAVGVLGADLFGDKINIYNGSLEFVQTDVSLPGNNQLPVSIGRRMVTGHVNLQNGAFSEWDLEIPRIHGIFSAQYGWRRFDSGRSVLPTSRCSFFGKPAPVNVSSYDTYQAFEYWYGNFMYVPGEGDQEVLRRDASYATAPADGNAWPLVTKGNWAIRCLPSLASTDSSTPPSDIGEGFLAISPEGTQYRFDWLVSRPASTLSKPNSAQASPVEDGTGQTSHASLPRVEVWILPTVVTDKFGNTVRYRYDPVNKARLVGIDGSDGRSITISYAGNFISQVSAGNHTWTYQYGAGRSGKTMLTSVVLPDNSSWNFNGLDDVDTTGRYAFAGLIQMQLGYRPDPDSPSQRCDLPHDGLDGNLAVGTMVHPSGATGRFVMQVTAHGRNGVPLGCYADGSANGNPYYPAFIDSYSVIEKTIGGPGLPTMTWSFDYSGTDVGGWDTCGAACIQPAVVLASNPAGEVTRYTFGATYAVDEGLLKQVDTGWNNGSASRSVTTRYNYSFTQPLGISDQVRGDNWIATHRIPVEQRMTAQQGVAFSWQVPTSDDFDLMGRPKKVVKTGNAGAKTELITYRDFLDKWVIGSTASITEQSTGKVMVANSYDAATTNLLSASEFGQLRASYQYNTDGTILTKSDALGHATTFSDYKRGVPRNVLYADGSIESAEINDDGTIGAVTDPLGLRTVYSYDAGGRISQISYPGMAGDPVWNTKQISFSQMQSDENGVAAGHWRQDVAEGSVRSNMVMDALWRPVFSQTYDLNNVANSIARSKYRYDHAGRTTFASYPAREYDDVGVNTTYDPLGRITEVRQDSELGALSKHSYYNGGFSRTDQDARGNSSTFSFQAFDTPTEEYVVQMQAPENLTLTINRDVFGKPTAVTRSGGGASATRSYVYDGYERLCKTIEPETGATLQQLDAANNVSWRAPGTGLTSLTCDLASVPEAGKNFFGYDALNRLISTSFGDGSASIGRDYWPDGRPKTVSSSGAVWTMNYNGRRLPTTQSLAFEGQTYTLATIYDANGHPVQLSYPSATNSIANQSVTYAPDGLGRPSQVGSYASAITYHANGAVAGFTYGNGKLRTMTQNLRGLPETARDAGVLQDFYAYDQNGNVTAITDQINAGPIGANTSRTMGYDGLDRLKVANSPGTWGGATYDYDTLDNLISSNISGRVSTYRYNLTNSRNLLENLQSTASGFNYDFTYDNRGNVRSRGAQTFTFDLGNRLTTAANLDTYVYDGFGRRVKTTAVDGTVTVSVYSPAGQLLYTRRTGGPNPAQSTQYIYLHSHQVAEVKK